MGCRGNGYNLVLSQISQDLRSPRLPGGSVSKESTCNAGDLGLIPELGGSPGEGYGNPLQYSCLENPMGRGATVCGGHNQLDTHLSNSAPTAQCNNLWIMFQNANRSKNISSMSFFPTVSLFDFIFLGNI